MKILVTGGTGLVGSHAVAALQNGGHDIRLLVRSPEKVTPAFEPLGVIPTSLETEVGDVVDRASVERALEGCDAVLHAAGMYSLDRRLAKKIRTVNILGTENVIGTAARFGLDPIVHVSSVAALLPPADGEILTPESPAGRPVGAYQSSKADSDRLARRFQQDGFPVVIVYPGGILGPHDPGPGETLLIARTVLRFPVAALPPGGINIVDVRDLAQVFVKLMAPGKGPRRFMATARFMTLEEIVDVVARVTGRKIRYRKIPGPIARFIGRASDGLQRVLPIRIPANYEGIWTLLLEARADDSATWGPLGLTFRDVDSTFIDTIRWMVEAGLIEPKHAGTLAA